SIPLPPPDTHLRSRAAPESFDLVATRWVRARSNRSAQSSPHRLDRSRSTPYPPFPHDDCPGSPPSGRWPAGAPPPRRHCRWLPTPACLLCMCDAAPTLPIAPARPALKSSTPSRWPDHALALLLPRNCPGAHRVPPLDLCSSSRYCSFTLVGCLCFTLSTQGVAGF